jgi:hypothetical protein
MRRPERGPTLFSTTNLTNLTNALTDVIPKSRQAGLVRDLLPTMALSRSRICAAARLVRDDSE